MSLRERFSDLPKPTRGDEGGFVLTWFALFLLVLMGMAGFAVDVWNWWYVGQKAQNAADAGALAGVVRLPDAAAADTLAKSTVEQNGFTAAETTTFVGSSNRELEVTVDTTITNFFTSLFGVTTTDISRDATAEFTGEVAMGSPENFLGTDPEDQPAKKLDYWLSVSSRNDSKRGGDRFQNRLCAAPDANCAAGISTEYDKHGYRLVINPRQAPTGDLRIQVWDAGNNGTNGQNCAGEGPAGSRIPSAFNRAQISSPNATSGHPGWPDAVDRFHSGELSPSGEFWCNGDVSDANNVTTFIMRAADSTRGDDLDNPVMTGSCAPKQYRGAEGGDYLQRLLTVYNGGGTARDQEFAENFRQWVTICTIPQATVAAAFANFGTDTEYILQVRSNSPFGSPCTNPPACDSATSTTYDSPSGRNHFSLRAGFGSTLSGDVRVYANGRLPMHAAVRGANTEFFLARVGSGNKGRFLQVEFFDVGDAGSPGTITILRPAESGGGAFPTCTFSRSDGGSLISSGCQLQNVQNSTGYNGQVVRATVTIPTTYTCNDADPLGCWVKLKFSYPSSTNVFDHTTWSAGLVGDPVRLTE